jgi:hypothetical protein
VLSRALPSVGQQVSHDRGDGDEAGHSVLLDGGERRPGVELRRQDVAASGHQDCHARRDPSDVAQRRCVQVNLQGPKSRERDAKFWKSYSFCLCEIELRRVANMTWKLYVIVHIHRPRRSRQWRSWRGTGRSRTCGLSLRPWAAPWFLVGSESEYVPSAIHSVAKFLDFNSIRSVTAWFFYRM